MTALRRLTFRAGVCGLALAGLMMPVAAAWASGDVKSGRTLTQKCEACHGADGVAKIVEAPNLAGQTEPYILKALTLYKTGERHNDMMSVVAPALSDQDIEDLAAYYSAIPITLGKLPGE